MRHGMKVSGACELLGVTKQAWYSYHQRSFEEAVDKDRIVECIHQIRQEMPGAGGRKLQVVLKRDYGIDIGRDSLFSLLREQNLLIKQRIHRTRTMHISRHAFAHIAQEAGAESSAIKNILGHSNLATTERYMGSFDTSKTDNTLRTLFKKKSAPKQTSQEEVDVAMTKEEQAIELLKGMTSEQIMAVISAINK